ncbi:CaiB/BaiF CoA-transferase family protein [Mycobacterium sp. NAZ190054]|uniref:CaiB/BaiF CoA transferase family protein n=1 Tax=Mycobacterium sp. NAZ190054 TaxID=1747766 RepID=UPI00079B5AB8|nr:CoA transferase [Mycobacterium sp. NAZ190054]KWX56497.1 hypothetical protein ASJ79_14325 [Mycobacterium sp. NAZ190054]
MSDHSLPLAGLRVIELSTVLMAPYCSQLLADWGADVIKIESPGGDNIRRVNERDGNAMGPMFVTANRGKRSIVIDLKDPRGLDLLHGIVKDADVFIHNIRPPAARRLGVDGPSLLRVNPSLIHCAFRGYGAGGPYEDRPAYDDVIQAASGVAASQGVGGAEPSYIRTVVADKVVGLYGAAAVCAAVAGRTPGGQGRIIEVPMFEGMASFMLLDRQGGWVGNPPLGPTGYNRADSVHRRPFRTSDGYLSVMVYTDRHWAAFFDLIGRPELKQDPRFGNLSGRTRHVDELYSMVAEELAKRPNAEWLDLLGKADIPHGPVNAIEDLFTDEHLSAVGFFQTLQQPGLGEVRLARSPIDMGIPPQPVRPAPLFGQHTEDVLREAGLTEDEVAKLVADGVVGTGR